MKEAVGEIPPLSPASLNGSRDENTAPPSPCRLAAQAERGDLTMILELADEWRAVCEAGRYNQPFFRPEWIHACAQAFAPAAKLLLITVREQGRLRAVLPLREVKRRFLGVPISRLSSITHSDYSCRFDIVHDSANGGDELIEAIWNRLKAQPEWDELELSNIPSGGGTEALLGLARRDGFRAWQEDLVRSPYIDLTAEERNGDFTCFVRSANLKRKLRRRWKKLQELGHVRLSREDCAGTEVLGRFYELERGGWKGKDGTAIACHPEVKQFYDLVAEQASHFGYFSLYFLEVSGKPIAAHFGLTLAGRYFPLKVAYDESYGEFSPGHLMLGQVLQDVIQQGAFECECLGDNEEWKMQWQVEIRPHSICHIYRNRRRADWLGLHDRIRHKLRLAAVRMAKRLLSSFRALHHH